MKALVTGAAGHLAAAIVEEFARAHDVAALTRAALDITDTRAVDETVARERPAVVINCAAYNDVDAAEDDPVAAFSVNAFAVQALARAAARCDAVFVHFSTDFVFDGRAGRPYTEDDSPGPLSVYGASKLVGEWLAAEARKCYVLRVESVFGGPTAGTVARAGSVGTILASIEAGREIPVFVDRVVSPTYARDAAAATHRIVTAPLPFGVYHCVNSGTCRWDELALEAARMLGRQAVLKPMTLDSVGLKARRPLFCALSNARLTSNGIVLGHWRDALRDYLATRARS